MNKEQHAEARRSVDHLIARGFIDEPNIVERVAEQLLFSEEGIGDEEASFEDIESAIKPLVAERLEKRRRAEQRWKRLTDCDKLDLAFADLEEQGIIARQDYWCCARCAHSAAGYEIFGNERGTDFWKGYVFYHEQDTDGAPGGSLLLGFGAYEDGDEAMKEVARTVIETLGRYKLKAEWNGKPDTRIDVVDLNWRWRRFTKRPTLKEA
jgi:hypothetical protein